MVNSSDWKRGQNRARYRGMYMKTKEIFTWLKLFIVSFVFIAVVWAGVQEYARFYAGVSFETPLERIALYSAMLAVVIATAQWVLSPRPKTADDYMRERMAETIPVISSVEMQSEGAEFEPAPPAEPLARRAKPKAKKKAAKKKGRR